jgi:5-bromo-4-chloroindolyl phosphate hydrolysis protein
MVGPNINPNTTRQVTKKKKIISRPDFNDPGQRNEQIAYLKQELRNTSAMINRITRKVKTERAVKRQNERGSRQRSPSPRKSGGLIKSTSRKSKKS